MKHHICVFKIMSSQTQSSTAWTSTVVPWQPRDATRYIRCWKSRSGTFAPFWRSSQWFPRFLAGKSPPHPISRCIRQLSPWNCLRRIDCYSSSVKLCYSTGCCCLSRVTPFLSHNHWTRRLRGCMKLAYVGLMKKNVISNLGVWGASRLLGSPRSGRHQTVYMEGWLVSSASCTYFWGFKAIRRKLLAAPSSNWWSLRSSIAWYYQSYSLIVGVKDSYYRGFLSYHR